MITDRKLANAVGGKTARPCDNCIKRRARWYCGADDAFLCQDCDALVHSANPLARRHERVRLKTASRNNNKLLPGEALLEASSVPSWHHGFTRKPRTPRQKKKMVSSNGHNNNNNNNNNNVHHHHHHHLVPEIFSDEASHEEEHDDDHQEQLLYRVPIFDPFVAELCTSSSAMNSASIENKRVQEEDDYCRNDMNDQHQNHQLHGSLPSDMDLAQFAADVECLLGQGFDDESFDMEGLMDCKEDDYLIGATGKVVKVEDEQEEEDDHPNNHEFDMEIDVTREPFTLSFEEDYRMVTSAEEEDVKIEKGLNEDGENNTKKFMLRLDYDEVITAWSEQKTPWTNGQRPQFDSLECWPYCLGTCGKVHEYGDPRVITGHAHHHRLMMNKDVGREARVSRYREKRRTRLFSKKIRYEVRKLNAEKRPRMKGRFVKRASFAAPSSSLPLLISK